MGQCRLFAFSQEVGKAARRTEMDTLSAMDFSATADASQKDSTEICTFGRAPRLFTWESSTNVCKDIAFAILK